jgi:K+-transporting ATPase ATPase B chain
MFFGKRKATPKRVSLKTISGYDWKSATLQSFIKLDPRSMIHNPVMLAVELGSFLTGVETVRYLVLGHLGDFLFALQISIWLWLTVLFANFAEALAEGRSKAHAAALRRSRVETMAKKVTDGRIEVVPATSLRKGDVVIVEAGDLIPADGEVVEGAASVDESAITGESAPVIREAGGDRSAVTGGTKVLSDSIKVVVSADPGEGYIDKMISLIESAVRQRTPNEIALSILLAGMTLVFVVVVVTLEPISAYFSTYISLVVLTGLFVCLAPTTIGGLLSAIGISGMNRMLKFNVLALSGRAIEAAGDVDVIMLDKTGTLTLGNRMAVEFKVVNGVAESELAEAAYLASLGDTTPEGRSIVRLAVEKYNVVEKQLNSNVVVHGFSARTRMSGVDLDGRTLRKGAVDAVKRYVIERGGNWPSSVDQIAEDIARQGGTPLVVVSDNNCLGVIHLKDVVKPGIKDRLERLRRAGIKTVMITGDNPLTAATIAKEVGVDEYLAEATPERKLEYVREQKAKGFIVAMVGDGTNDAPALAQADVAVVMNTGTQAAREAGNMVDLDSNPIKLLDIVEIGKQILITRGALTTFSVANDVAKYFAIVPAMFYTAFPALRLLNVMQLTSPQSAILSAVIFNAIIIPLLIPLALRGVRYRPRNAIETLQRNLVIYGFGGLVAPFVGIKIIDIIVSLLHLVKV